MLIIDANVFLINRFFKRDPRFLSTQRFISQLPKVDAGVSIYTLYEICGLSAFNLSLKEWEAWFHDFRLVYPVEILYPINTSESIKEFFKKMEQEMYRLLSQKIGFVDALMLSIAEEHSCSHIITWNKKHFESKTSLIVKTPQEFLD